MFQRVNYGEITNEKNATLRDLTVRERWVLGPAVAMVVFMGVAPGLFLRPMEASVARVVQQVREAVPETAVAAREAPVVAAERPNAGRRLAPGSRRDPATAAGAPREPAAERRQRAGS